MNIKKKKSKQSSQSLQQADIKYLKSLMVVSSNLRKAYNSIGKNYKFNLTKTDISEAIIKRLSAYYYAQNEIKKLLDKGYLAAASDFFVESVLFYLKLYLKSVHPSYEVKSEKDILIQKYIDSKGKKRRKVIRPDITIYNKFKEVVIVIECKTQFGWNRGGWENEFETKEAKLHSVFPKAKAFLLVMTGSNWSGFGNNKLKGNKYFCLLENTWPTEYSNINQIQTKIEDLFKLI